MRSPTVNWLVRLVLVPVWTLLVGFTPGPWHCADGRPCAVATVACCCCDAEERPDHACDEEPPEVALTAGECGCYQQALTPDVASGKTSWLPAPAAPPAPAITCLCPNLGTVLARAVPPAAHGPPRYLTALADPRGPPLA